MSCRIKKSKSDVVFDIINYSLLTLVLIIVLYPLWFVVIASFSDPLSVLRGEVWLFPKGFSVDAYKEVFANKDIMVGYKNTCIYTLLGTAVNLIMTIMAAYPLSRKDFYGRGTIMALFTFTMFFGGGLIPTYLVYDKIGLINNIWVMILPGAVGVYNLILMKSFFETSIPHELQEAAVIDGCNNLQILSKIIVPLSKPIIAVMVIFYGVAHWNEFFNALIYISDRKKIPLQLVLREILITQSKLGDMAGMDSSVAQKQLNAERIKYAVIIVSSLPVLCLYPFLQKYFMKGVMIGAIKG